VARRPESEGSGVATLMAFLEREDITCPPFAPPFAAGIAATRRLIEAGVGEARLLLEDLALSVEQNDQIGRYLAQTGVALLSNVRGFGLLACAAAYSRPASGSVPPDKRSFIKTVDLWSAVTGTGPRAKVDPAAIVELLEIIERSVTDYAPIADPADLAKVLARQARDAKESLPDDLRPVTPLLDDYRQALGLSFKVDDEKGDRQRFTRFSPRGFFGTKPLNLTFNSKLMTRTTIFRFPFSTRCFTTFATLPNRAGIKSTGASGSPSGGKPN
jgi:hypothetical protein